MRIVANLCVLVLACGLVSAQHQRTARLNIAQPNSSGIASWYGRREQGKRMANGQRFDRNKYTAASRTYKLGTVLRVTFPTKGTFVTVVVTDRGPWVKQNGSYSRVLDLSERAAQTLGLRPYGVAQVTIEPWHVDSLKAPDTNIMLTVNRLPR